MAVQAPFRFAPIHRRVWFPEWGPLVSHDVPFADGLSGEIPIEITAETPLLVGGPRRKPAQQQPGEVWPVETIDRDGRRRYAIPGSSLQGLVRSILEIAAFGRLGPFVEDRRFGIRDIRSATGIEFYQGRMTSKSGNNVTQLAKAGWLVKTQSGRGIVPCEFARIDFQELMRLKGGPDTDPQNILISRNTAWQRYEWFVGPNGAKADLDRDVVLGPATDYSHAKGTIQIRYRRAQAPGAGASTRPSTLVFTGKPQPGTGPGHKKLEFVFHSPARPAAAEDARKALPVDDSVWNDFSLIHFEHPGRDENPNWTFWRDEFETGRPVPVFYLEESGRISTLGTAFMFKAAFRLSTHDLLRNSTRDHIPPGDLGREEDRFLDLPSLIFGQVAERSAGDEAKFVPLGLKRRASFDLALAGAGSVHAQDFGRTILLGPKPSYYPIYVRQPGDQMSGRLPAGQQLFAVYQSKPDDISERIQPELAGAKVWPARGSAPRREIPHHLRGQNKVQTWLQVLPAGTRFRTTLRFHNLRVCEIGALLWALSFGDAVAWTPNARPRLRHRLGMGKPLGLGEISVQIDAAAAHVWPNQPTATSHPATWVTAFETEVGAFTAQHGMGWKDSIQVKTLLKAADPMQGAGAALAYMQLNPPHANEFQAEKNHGHFLPRYVTGAEFIRAASNPGAGGAAGGAAPREMVRAKPTETANETVWERARLHFNAQNGRLTATGPANTTAFADAPRGLELFSSLPADLRQQIQRNPRAVPIVVTVRGSQLVAVRAAS